jgi:hypothetical protein
MCSNPRDIIGHRWFDVKDVHALNAEQLEMILRCSTRCQISVFCRQYAFILNWCVLIRDICVADLSATVKGACKKKASIHYESYI